MPRYEGRLELTWTNKDQCLLAHDDGSYEWLPTSDYRVAEVRLLGDVQPVGDVGKRRAADNLLIEGDALHGLTSLIKLPEFRREYVGKVKLAYLDPPFNTGQAFEQYDDALEHSVWLTMMRDRLSQVYELLSDDGSVWVHLDDVEAPYCRAILDDIFGRQNFVGTFVWEKDQGRRNDTDVSTVHDYIILFAKNRARWKGIRNLLPRSAQQISRYRNPDNDARGPWLQGADSTAKSGNEDSRFEVELPSGRKVRPPSGVYWRFTPVTFKAALDEGRVYFGADGDGMPIIKRYLTDVQDGVVPRTWWPAAEVGSNMGAKRDHLRRLLPEVTPFATPKPEPLIERILQIGTNPGDVVLDCFVGSGTTAAVALKTGRRFVVIERSPDTVISHTIPRLRKVIAGEDPGGITSIRVPTGEGLPEGVKTGEANTAAKVIKKLYDADRLADVGLDEKTIEALVRTLKGAEKTRTETRWSGGGGFRHLRVGPSMFEEDGGIVFLSDRMTNGLLAEATAAQLGFDYEVEAPFVGRKGRARLAVIDGVVNEGVIKLLVVALAAGERVVVCGTGIDPDARTLLRELAPGSTLRKIPAALLDRYRASEAAARAAKVRAGESTGESRD
ncbi:site-specific DNA-methyltransferase [Micromonospora sediminicola]|uniref:site-specific DNA-methyltransferase n=1 Tax=Micromonospora sediminicola TaxID=946078 RepID=UPI0033C71B06